MRRVSGFVLTLLGAFLLLLAVLLRYWVVPENLKIPLNAYKITHLAGDGSYLSHSTGTQVSGISVGVTTTAQGDVLAGDSDTAVYNVFSSVEDVTHNVPISYYEYREAFDRKTSQIVNCCGEYVTNPAGQRVPVPMSGLALTFPIGSKKQNYVIFDPAPARPELVRYAGTGSVDGIAVYRYVEQVSSVLFGSQAVPDSIAGFPGSGTANFGEYYTATNTYYVDPETGAPLDTTQNQLVTLGPPATPDKIVATNLTLAQTPSSVRDVVNTDIHYRNVISLARDTLPSIGLLVGLLIMLVGLLLVRYGGEGSEDEFRWLWRRQLHAYPDNGPRLVYLAITVLATVTLYYELYVGGSVSTLLLVNFHMSFTFFVVTLAFGSLLGAFGSLFAGLADRLGRTNMVVFGLLLTGIFTAYVLPAATNKWIFVGENFVVSVIEGIALVATPALIRDFSPQVGRATAMGFWTAGPVLGSLVVTVVASNTIPVVVPDSRFWTHEYHICGAVGLIVFAITLFGLRELSPQLRDQLMVTMRDRILVEARAKGLDVGAMLHKPFRQLFKVDVVVPAIAVSAMLLIYYTAVGFGLIYLVTVFGFSTKNANGLLNWNWGFNVIAVILVGMLSDLVRVRKPFMVIGGVGAAVMTFVYLQQAGHHPGYYKLALIVGLLSLFIGTAYTPWMASFTETVEARNPALTATGLAIWGWIIRVVVFTAFLIIPHIITSVSPLVDYGQTAQAYQQQYSGQIAFAQSHPAIVATAQKYERQLLIEQQFAPEFTVLQAHQALFTKLATYTNPARIPRGLLNRAIAAAGGGTKGLNVLLTIRSNQKAIQSVAAVAPELLPLKPYAAQLTALSKVPPSVLSFLQVHGPTVLAAQARAPREWKRWYWACLAGIVFFLLCIPLAHGRWRPSDARRDEREHQAATQVELDKLYVS